jgi:TPR repeat protein
VWANGSGVAADPGKAAAFLDRACQAGDGEGCRDLAVAYEKGNGVPRDRRRASELYKKSCELGFKAACGK